MTATSPDIYSEDSVFRKLFSDVPKPRKSTQAERLARAFGDTTSLENTTDLKVPIARSAPPQSENPIEGSPIKEVSPIKVSDFLPRF